MEPLDAAPAPASVPPAAPAKVRPRLLVASAWIYGAVAAGALAWTRAPRPPRPVDGLDLLEDGTRGFALWLLAYAVGLAWTVLRVESRDSSSRPGEALVLLHAVLGLVATAGLMGADLGEGALRTVAASLWEAIVLPAAFAVFLGWLGAFGLLLTCRRAWAYFWVCTLAPIALVLLKVR